ncbi:MAG: c-type cytochrome [Pseudomonadota bacterium]
MRVTDFLSAIDRAMGGVWIGSAVGAVLVFMLLGFFSGKIFGHGGGHSEDEPLAFALEIEETVVVEEEPTIDLAALAMAADLDAGEKVFAKCRACHKMADGENGVGPHLWGVVGRGIGSVGGYSYGDHLASVGGEWDLASLSGFLENPKGWAPGTKMSFAGLKKPEDRVNLIAWMNEADGSPIELATAPSDTATDATVEDAGAGAAGAGEEPAAEEEASGGDASDDDATEATDDDGAALEAEPAEQTAAAEPEADAADTGSAEASVTETDATENDLTETAALTEPAVATNAEEVNEGAENAVETTLAPSEEAVEEAAAEPAPAAVEESEAAAPSVEESTELAAVAPAETAAHSAPAADSPFAELLASADPDAGAKVFRKCRACHKAEEGRNGVGPSLWGVVGSQQAAVDGYKYSGALQGLGGTWTLAELDAFLAKPKEYAPGTKMAFAGLKKPEDRVNLIVYLNEKDGTPVPLH